MTVEIIKNQNLAKFSYFGIGGNADEIWRISDVKSLSEAWGETFAEKIPRIVLGAGSNCVFSDLGFRGRVFVFTGKEFVWQKNLVTIEAGASLQKVVENFAENGWADLNNLSGIPGTLGGAVRGNAGAHGSEISDKIVEVEYIDENGMIRKIPRNLCEFNYRTSVFKNNPNWMITRATFQFTGKGDPEKITKEVKEQFIKRVGHNPSGRSGGSFFKNPPENFAGKLLDEAGAKGDQIGDAQVSKKHANFLLNKGKATQKDILKLAKKWQTRVREKFNIELEPEVVLLDEYGKIIKLNSF
jgi:UDP-N-acetylmuramate dehydrogenase